MRKLALALSALAACAYAAPASANSSSAAFMAPTTLTTSSGSVISVAAFAPESGSSGIYSSTMALRSTSQVQTLTDGGKVIGSLSVVVSGCTAITAQATSVNEASASISCTSVGVILRDASGNNLLTFGASQLASSVMFNAPGTVKGSVTNTSALLTGRWTGSHVIGATAVANTVVASSSTVTVTYRPQVTSSGSISLAAISLKMNKAPISTSTVTGTITLLPAAAN